MYVCMYVCMYDLSTGIYVQWCGTGRYSIRYVHSHILLRMRALAVSGARWCGTGRYSIKYIHTGVEGNASEIDCKARQRIAQGIPVLQRIPSY